MLSLLLGAGAGDGIGTDPATLPEESVADVDRELLDLLCEDAEWLDETFRAIVATSWDEPPRGGSSRSAARPRRFGSPARRVPPHDGDRRSQWRPLPQRYQRSPPADLTAESA